MPRAQNDWKICTRCSEKKPVGEFGKDSLRADGLCYQCKSCRAIMDKAHYDANRDERLAQQRGHYKANCKEILARHAEYRATEGGKVTQKRGWLSEAHKQADQRRRAHKLGAEGSHAIAEFVDLCEALDFRCQGCGEVFPLEALTEDHVLPLGPPYYGSDWIENIQPLCGPCNSSKGHRTMEEWLTWKGPLWRVLREERLLSA